MLTGHSEKKRVTAARDAGVTEFLAKPISAKGLYQRIVNVVANPRPVHQDQDLFRPRPPPQRQRELCRPRTPQGRQGRRDPPSRSARKSPRSRLTKAVFIMARAQEHGRDRHLRRSRGHHAGKQAAQGGFRHAVMPGEDDPVARAERALAATCRRIRLDGWTTNASVSTTPAARCSQTASPKATKENLFLAAHDIKGEAATFGYPAVAAAADSLCRLIEYTPDATRIPLKLVDQHVDAVRAIVREYERADAAGIGCDAERPSARSHRRIPDPRKPQPAGCSRTDYRRTVDRSGMSSCPGRSAP